MLLASERLSKPHVQDDLTKRLLTRAADREDESKRKGIFD